MVKRRFLQVLLVLGVIGGFGWEASRACRRHHAGAPCAHPCHHHGIAPGVGDRDAEPPKG